MDNFPSFQWKIDIHDDECYETTVSGSFGPFNTVDIFSEGNNDFQLQQTLEDLSQTFNFEQQRWIDLINGATPYGM